MTNNTTIGVLIFLAFWGFNIILRELKNIQFPIKIIVFVETEENDELDIPNKRFEFRKKMPMQISPFVGMEIEHDDFYKGNLKVVRVIVHNYGTAIECEPVKYSEKSIDDEIKYLEKEGWTSY